MAPKKESLEIKGKVDLVSLLTKAEQKPIKDLKIKHTGYSYSLKISSHQAHVRKAEVMAVGEKQLHAGKKILMGFLKEIKDPKKLDLVSAALDGRGAVFVPRFLAAEDIRPAPSQRQQSGICPLTPRYQHAVDALA